MLISKPKSKIVIKYGYDKTGNFLRGYFLVTETEGKFSVKLLRVEVVKDLRLKVQGLSFKNKTKTLQICGSCQSSPSIFNLKPYTYSVSPFYTFDFFTSQMTRAPSGLN